MRATWFLIASWILVSFTIWFLPNQSDVLPLLGYSTENIAEGRIWTLFTSIFIHADIVHLLMNSLAFVFFGLACEKEIGPRRMLMVFFLGAFLGDALSSLLYGYSELSVGASGGVSSVLGAAIFLAPFRFSMFPYILPAPIVVVGGIYIVSNLMGLFFPTVANVSYAAHIGGLAFGVGYGFSHVGSKRGLFIVLTGFILIVLLAYLLGILRA